VKREIKGKEEARKLLAEVPQEDVFRCHDGQVLRSMKELSNAFSEMTDETFAWHFNSGKKNLSNWVRNIIGDVKLATELEGSTSRSLAAWEVATRMAYLARQTP